jgi:hypothetical protein
MRIVDCVDYDTACRLKAAGFPQDGYNFYFDDTAHLCSRSNMRMDEISGPVAAPTATQILSLIPGDMDIKRRKVADGELWFIGDLRHYETGNTLEIAAAKTWIHLAEHKK